MACPVQDQWCLCLVEGHERVHTWIFPATKRCSTVERSLSLSPAWCSPMPNCRLCLRLVSCTSFGAICVHNLCSSSF